MKRVVSFLVVCLMSMCLLVPAFASDDVRTGNATGGGSTGTGNSGTSIQDTVNNVTNELIAPDVTTGDIVDRLENKGNDLVHIFQTVGKYVCFIAFIIFCIMALIGIGNKRWLLAGIIGLVLSGVAYAGIVCGREIVNWVAAWAVS